MSTPRATDAVTMPQNGSVARRARVGHPILVGAVIWGVSLFALAAVLTVQHLSADGRQAQVVIEQLRREQSTLPTIAFASALGPALQDEALSFRLAEAKQAVKRSLRSLRHYDGDEQTHVLPGLFAGYLRDIEIVLSLVQNGRVIAAAEVFGRAERPGGSSDILRRQLQAASRDAKEEAAAAERLSDIGTVLAIVALLLAFSVALLLVRRSIRRVEVLGVRNDELLALSQRDEARYRELFENATEPIATVALDWTVTDANVAFARALGLERKELIGSNLNSYLSHAGQALSSLNRELKLAQGRDSTTYEQEFIARGGHVVTFEVSTRVIKEDGVPVGIQGMCRDITDRKQAEALLRAQLELNGHQALHDALTGLPNRVSFAQSVAAEITKHAGNGADSRPGFAVLMLDLDRFKEVNDSLGHQSGDALLEIVGRRIRTELRDRDTVARLGGDEFGVLLADLGEHADWRSAVARITKALERPMEVGGVPLGIEVSIGIAFHPEHGADVDELLQHADMAMYDAKNNGVSDAVYDHTTDRNTNVTLVGELRRAISERELVLHYQPKLDLRTDHVPRLEALIRWNHPEQGLLMPGQFMPVAEQTGLIKPITRFVLDEAVRQCREWELDGLQLAVSVNVSVRNLAEPDLPEDLVRILERWQLEPERLIIEVTESAIAVDEGRNEKTLQALKDLGVKLALDDFGAGNTSISHLARLPIDQIKVDRSLVKRITTDRRQYAVAAAMIDLAGALGLEVVAEAIEDAETLTAVRELGCDFAQGYHISRPLPPAEVTAWLKRDELPAVALA